ncbi:MAG: universal stress protein [Deltaproteobacteria bacterium]|nr:universal stress protein [Deltaproteobacteria bacterium]
MIKDTRFDSTADSRDWPHWLAAGEIEPGGVLTGRRASEDPETPRPEKGIPHHLLVCLDRSPESEHLIRHASALARAWRARLTLIHILESGSEEGLPHPADAVEWRLRRQEARRYLTEVGSKSIYQDLQVSTTLAEGRAFEEIQTWSQCHAVDLTILSTHGEKGRTGCGLSGTAYKLIDGSSGSFLVVPAGEPSQALAEEALYKRILVPLDGSLHAESVLPIAAQLAIAHHAEIVLAHVVAAPELMRSGPPTAEDRALEEAVIARNESVARDYLAEIQTYLQDSRFRIRTYLSRRGNPRDELLRFIHDEAVDLVVLSAHGVTGATDRALGSVAAHLVAHVRVPLLLTRNRTMPKFREDRASSMPHDVPARLPSAMTA